MIVKKYHSNLKQQWNNLIMSSRQGTFLLNRDYMDYHSDRFVDNSLLFYNEKEELIAILPANIKDGILYSHQGLSYGGLIYGKKVHTIEILQCFEELKNYAKENNIQKLIYKRIPYIYHNYPADEDLYALFVNEANLIRRDIGYAISLFDPIRISRNKIRYLKNFDNYKIAIIDDYKNFYLILEEALKNHNAKPIHSSEELKLLTERFPDDMRLYGIFDERGTMVAGGWIFLTTNVVHVQYMVATNAAREANVIDYGYDYLIKSLSEGKKYFSFGISTEQDGKYLNLGLAWQKESFGGRGVSYDFYELNFFKKSS